MKRESFTAAFNPTDLLLTYLASQGCRHEWVMRLPSEERRIICRKCGLTAYAGLSLGRPTKKVCPSS